MVFHCLINNIVFFIPVSLYLLKHNLLTSKYDTHAKHITCNLFDITLHFAHINVSVSNTAPYFWILGVKN